LVVDSVALLRYPGFLLFLPTELQNYRSFIIYTTSSYQDDPIHENKMAGENKYYLQLWERRHEVTVFNPKEEIMWKT
jgi:hypothetical protein